MTATGHRRGHPIEWDAHHQQWRYADTQQLTGEAGQERPCFHCGQHATAEGHDPCLGTLPDVANACCGHGQEAEAYVQLEGGQVIRGRVALALIEILKARREAAGVGEYTPEMAGSGQRGRCAHCGELPTPEGHDGCVGTLPESVVMNACCGHGRDSQAYVQYWGGEIVRGAQAIEQIEELKARRAGRES